MTSESFFFQDVDLHMLDKLRVQEGEASKLILVEIHHEQLVGGCQVHALAGELPVEVGNILSVALEMEIGIRRWRELYITVSLFCIWFVFFKVKLIVEKLCLTGLERMEWDKTSTQQTRSILLSIHEYLYLFSQ